MATVTSEEVLLWRPLIDDRATRLNGVGGAEFDDLVQEAWIKVWLLLEEGIYPTQKIVDHAMIDYIRQWSNRGQTNRSDGKQLTDDYGDPIEFVSWELLREEELKEIQRGEDV